MNAVAQHITLSIETVAASMPYPPAVSSPSSMLEARAEPVAANVPSYRIVLTNRSTIPLMSLRFEGYRGETRVISGLRRDCSTRWAAAFISLH